MPSVSAELLHEGVEVDGGDTAAPADLHRGQFPSTDEPLDGRATHAESASNIRQRKEERAVGLVGGGSEVAVEHGGSRGVPL